MIKTTVGVEGMACPMCEAHVNDAVRGAFQVDKVTSSHKKKQTVILSAEPLDEATLTKTINDTGYTVTSIESHQEQKKRGLFGR